MPQEASRALTRRQDRVGYFAITRVRINCSMTRRWNGVVGVEFGNGITEAPAAGSADRATGSDTGVSNIKQSCLLSGRRVSFMLRILRNNVSLVSRKVVQRDGDQWVRGALIKRA